MKPSTSFYFILFFFGLGLAVISIYGASLLVKSPTEDRIDKGKQYSIASIVVGILIFFLVIAGYVATKKRSDKLLNGNKVAFTEPAFSKEVDPLTLV